MIYATIVQARLKGVEKMELNVSEEKTKLMLKEVFSELLEEKRDFFTAIMMDALEEIGLANAIREGRQDDFVGEDEVRAILRGQA